MLGEDYRLGWSLSCYFASIQQDQSIAELSCKVDIVRDDQSAQLTTAHQIPGENKKIELVA
jgi:hypothetical protein